MALMGFSKYQTLNSIVHKILMEIDFECKIYIGFYMEIFYEK